MTYRKSKEYPDPGVNLMTIINQAREWNAPLNEIKVVHSRCVEDRDVCVMVLYWTEEEGE